MWQGGPESKEYYFIIIGENLIEKNTYWTNFL
jgi:hypothetical protein